MDTLDSVCEKRHRIMLNEKHNYKVIETVAKMSKLHVAIRKKP